jgi:hypothetical protein
LNTSISEINNVSTKENKGIIYLIIFNVLVFLFLISFFKVACSDPGKYNPEYVNLYSLEKYYQVYNKYYQNLIFSKEKINSPQTQKPLEFPNMNFKSSQILAKKTTMKE